jgi:hypothetical protein
MIPFFRKLTTACPLPNPVGIAALDEVRNGVPPKNLIAAWLRSWLPALYGRQSSLFSRPIHFPGHQPFHRPVMRCLLPSVSAERIPLLHHLV